MNNRFVQPLCAPAPPVNQWIRGLIGSVRYVHEKYVHVRYVHERYVHVRYVHEKYVEECAITRAFGFNF